MYKHLTGEQRVIIEDRLNHKKSVRSIAKELGVSPSTVLREIKRHTDNQGATGNDCALRRDCRNRHLCGRFDCNRLCHNCNIKCKKYCHDYIQMYCDRRAENPLGLCNGCTKVKFCNIEKSFYRGAIADKQYRDTLSESRAGFDLTAKEFQIVNELASPLIKMFYPRIT